MSMKDTRERRTAALQTPTGLNPDATRDISAALNLLLADVYALYIKTKNFHWHVSGPHFRDYHLLLDEQADQIFAIADTIAERVRKVGGTTLRSIAHIARLKASAGQRRRLRHATGHAGGAARRQQRPRSAYA
jgi:starvation-inducible DNA-binding protein